MPNLRRTMLVFACLGVAACAPASPAGPAPSGSPSPLPGGYASVTSDEARVRAALEAGLTQLEGPEWLNHPELTAGPVAAAERQVVAGTNYRVSLPLRMNGKERPARLTIYEDLQGALRLTAVDLAPFGEAPSWPEPPVPSELAGGWRDQPAGDPEIAQTAEKARTILASADWLARSVTLGRVVEARTQVVAGLNTYLVLEVQLDAVPRQAAVIVYQPLRGEPSLSWVQLSAPPASGR